uniref:Guanylate kinase n=1 Tax=candidate division WOR-3 bacterium TaxID=2052148 RepID=A0A7C4YHD6_UNCW3
MIIVISGPSGSGKSTIVSELKKENYLYSISVTTRKKRENEINGRDYFFVSVEEFKKMIEEGKFLEYAKVYGNYYGTLKKTIYNALKENKDIILDLDTKGSIRIKKLFKDDALLIFLLTDTIETLKERLLKRSTENEEEIRKRINAVKKEIKDAKKFDYIVMNMSIDGTIEEIKNIIASERKKISRNLHILENFLKNL